MIISEDFLLIENGKAILKTLDKEIHTYECLLQIKERIAQLNHDDLIKRLASFNVDEEIDINDIFLKEIENAKCNDSIEYDHKTDLNLSNNSKDELLTELNQSKKENLKFKELSVQLKAALAEHLIETESHDFGTVYIKYKQKERRNFIKEKLEEDHIAFCEKYTPNGWHTSSFNYNNITIIHKSNFGYGSLSYSNFYIRFDDIIKIINVDRRGEYDWVSLNRSTSFSLNIVKQILNNYLPNPDQFKKKLLKNNIRKLKNALELEKDGVPIIEDVVIPDLKKRIKTIENNKKTDLNEDIEYMKLTHTLKRFIDGDSYSTVNTFSDIATTIAERKKRIELLKFEINRLIILYKEDDGLLDPV